MAVPAILVFALVGVLGVPLVLVALHLFRRRTTNKRTMSGAHLVAIAFGIDAGLLGFEHGYFETLQGNGTPSGAFITAIGPPVRSRPHGTAASPRSP